jgi:hypothetical protein
VHPTGYGRWLDERDQMNALANDPRVQAEQREIDRQARIARLGFDPFDPAQVAARAASRRTGEMTARKTGVGE